MLLRRCSLILCFLVLLLPLLTWADEAAPRVTAAAICVADGVIKVDGRDDDWRGLGAALERCKIASETKEKMLIWEPLFGGYGGPEDASLTVYTAHDSKNLYILADVHDDLLINQSTAESPFMGDDFEVYIDAGPAGVRFTTSKTPDYMQLIFLPGHLNTALPRPLIWQGKARPGVQAASRLRPWGYSIEIAIPTALFPNWAANPGLDSIGFDVMTTDCDTAGIDCHHAAVKSSCYALSPAQHHASAEHLALLKLEQGVPLLPSPIAGQEKTYSINRLCKMAKTATPENAEMVAQAILDRIDDKQAGKLADAAVRSPQPLVRKAGLFVLYQRKELKAPVAQMAGLLSIHAQTETIPPTLTEQSVWVYAMLALAERGQLPVIAASPYTMAINVPAVRLSTIWALGLNADGKAVKELSAALHDEKNYRARMAAALALGILGDPAALPALQETETKDADMYCRQQAKEAIAKIQAKQGGMKK